MRSPWRLFRGSLVPLVAAALFLSACGGGTIRVAVTDSAGCTAVETVPPYAPADLDRSHIGGGDLPVPPPLSSYASRPPASGPHDPRPLASGVYRMPPPVDQTIHSLEHAAVIVWVPPTVLDSDPQTAEFGRLAAFFARPEEIDHVIVAPYNYPDQGPAGMLPAETSMALVAWHRLQLCQRVSLSVALGFVTAYRFDPDAPGRYQGEAPEQGVPIG